MFKYGIVACLGLVCGFNAPLDIGNFAQGEQQVIKVDLDDQLDSHRPSQRKSIILSEDRTQAISDNIVALVNDAKPVEELQKVVETEISNYDRAEEQEDVVPVVEQQIPEQQLVSVSKSATKVSKVSTSRMPEFSWDTLPLYMHIRKVTAFTKEELKYLSKFPLITLEKTTGQKEFGSSDVGTIEGAKAIKEVNPQAKVLFYRNVICHYGGYSFDKQLKNIPDWHLTSKKGSVELVRGRLKAYDTSNDELIKWWVDNAAEVVNNKYIDGLFLDGNIKSLSSYIKRSLPKGKKEETIDGYHRMMTQTRAALKPEKLMIANIIRARFPESGNEFMNYFDGSYLECFEHAVGMKRADYIVKGIEATRKAAQEGKIIAMTLGIKENSVGDDVDEGHARIDGLADVNQERLHYNMALFLICAEKYSYLFMNDGYCVDTRRGKCQSGLWLKTLPEYKKPLGPPKGPAKRNGYVYTREFKHASVRFDAENGTGKVTWK